MTGMRPDLSGVDPLVINLTHRTTIGDMLTRGAHIYGERPAIIDGERVLTYRALEAKANAAARGLLAAGLARGNAVALQVQNRLEFVIAFFACAKIGVTVLPLNLALSAADIGYQLADSGVRTVITEHTFLPTLEAALQTDGTAVQAVYVVDAQPETVAGREAADWAGLFDHDGGTVEVIVEDRDILQCLYTSGTTSKPKGVLTSHVAVQLAVLNSALALGIRPGREGAVMPIVLPLFHVTALDVLLLPILLTGGTTVLHRGFDAGVVLGDFATHRVTHLALLPAMWAAILEHPELDRVDRSRLQTGLYAMAPMPAERISALRAAFPNADIILGSGQTETTPVSQVQWREHQGEKDNSWGPAAATTDVAIMAPDGRLLPTGEEGEIVYRTPQLMEGYWNNRDANTAAFAHGWFHGGDIGYLDDEAVVWFTDRTKDIIKTGGENVSSVEVERVVLAHPAVAEAAAIGLPDARWGEAVAVVVVPREGLDIDPADLRAHCKAHLAGFKVPKEFIVADALPKTATGKITKHIIRERFGRR